MYQALYRKWRPKAFADVIGQEHITETLRRQVAEGRTSHAYLFTGTRGTGKTTCAKILAKAVNCEAPVDGDPCGKCPSCVGIDSGGFLDVLELDAASNNGVDQVRALRDEAVYSPANVKKRVYIVDEVHMLSTAAFNALLKILEEPPEHLMFILATTELHKVPATILSRCQRFSFRRIRPEDAARRLSYVAEQESIDLRPDGAELLSRLADGALRDVLGLAGNLQTARLMELILSRDAQEALLLLDELYKGGKDMGAVLSELSTLTRDLLLQKTAPKGGAALLSGGYDAAALDRLGKGVPAGRFLHLASTLQKASAELYASANRRLDAELCLLRLCDESLSGDLTALEARIARLEDNQAARAALAQRPGAAPPEQAPPPHKEPPAPPKFPDPPPWDEPPLPEEPPITDGPGQRVYDIPEAPPLPPEPPKPFSAPQAPAAPAAGNAPARAVDGGWWRTLAENCKNRLSPMYRPFLGMCSGFLEGDLLTVCAPDDLTLGRLDNDRVREILEQEAEALTGSPVRLILRTGEAPKSSPEENLKNLVAFGRQFDNIEITE